MSVFATPIDNTRYTSQCFLDGIPVNVNSSTTTANVGQSQPVCAVFGLAGNTVHTISVVVSVETPDHYDPLSGFAFDYILIVPEAGTSLWKSDSHDIFLPILSMVAIVNSSTPVANVGLYFSVGLEQIGHFTPDWEYDPLNGFQTTTPEARFTVTFTGTGVRKLLGDDVHCLNHMVLQAGRYGGMAMLGGLDFSSLPTIAPSVKPVQYLPSTVAKIQTSPNSALSLLPCPKHTFS